MVDNLDNGREAAGLELEHTANLDTTPRAGSDLNLGGHVVGGRWSIPLGFVVGSVDC